MATDEDPDDTTDGSDLEVAEPVDNFPVGDEPVAALPPQAEAVVALDTIAPSLTVDASGVSDY